MGAIIPFFFLFPFHHQQFHFAPRPGHTHTHTTKRSCPTHCFKTACSALAFASGLSSFLVRLIHSIWLRAWPSDSGKSFWSRPFPHHPGWSESSLSWPLKCSSPVRIGSCMPCVVAKTVALPVLVLAIVVVCLCLCLWLDDCKCFPSRDLSSFASDFEFRKKTKDGKGKTSILFPPDSSSFRPKTFIGPQLAAARILGPSTQRPQHTRLWTERPHCGIGDAAQPRLVMLSG